eukprot:7389529-Prymnesium_polylepis.1
MKGGDDEAEGRARARGVHENAVTSTSMMVGWHDDDVEAQQPLLGDDQLEQRNAREQLEVARRPAAARIPAARDCR